MSIVTITAVKRFTTALADGTIVHMDPASKVENQRVRPNTPVTEARRMLERGWIEDGFEEAVDEEQLLPDVPAMPLATTRQASPAPAGFIPPVAITADDFKAAHKGGGHYDVTGPGIDGVLKVSGGRDEVAPAIDKLVREYNARTDFNGIRQHPTGPSAGADTTDEAGRNTDGDGDAEDDADAGPAS